MVYIILNIDIECIVNFFFFIIQSPQPIPGDVSQLQQWSGSPPKAKSTPVTTRAQVTFQKSVMC